MYFYGEKEISKEELEIKGRAVGDWVLKEFRNEDEVIDYSIDEAEKWREVMERWLIESGYTKIPENDVPEINVSYSDIPHN